MVGCHYFVIALNAYSAILTSRLLNDYPDVVSLCHTNLRNRFDNVRGSLGYSQRPFRNQPVEERFVIEICRTCYQTTRPSLTASGIRWVLPPVTAKANSEFLPERLSGIRSSLLRPLMEMLVAGKHWFMLMALKPSSAYTSFPPVVGVRLDGFDPFASGAP